jgi:hypothetical protein
VIVTFDANFILMLLDPRARVPKRVGKPAIKSAKERIELLVEELSRKKAKLILPTPALAEFFLLASDSYERYLQEIKRRSAFEVIGFDDSACIELVDISIALGKPKKTKPEDTWAKLKYDRQIVAIAKVNRASVIYSTDDGLRALAAQVGMKALDLEDLPEPPPKQTELNLVSTPKTKNSKSPSPDATGTTSQTTNPGETSQTPAGPTENK